MDQAQRFEIGLTIVREAGELALGYFNNREALTVKNKGLQDVVSEADTQTEVLIRKRLSASCPGDGFLGEETGHASPVDGQGIWVVDPIDGTQPFVNGMSSWCVSMAYVADGKVQFGMVNAPARNEIFAGGLGFPATLNGVRLNPRPVISVRDGLIGTGYSPKSGPDDFLPSFERLLRAGGMFYRDGSGALGLCYVAAGRLIGFYEPLIRSWDCLGALAVVAAAGLRTSNFLAGDGLHKGNPLIAAHPGVYDELRALIGDAPWAVNLAE